MKPKKLNYKKAGVDIEKADQFVSRLQKLTQKTKNKNVISGVGGFASLYQINKNQYIAAGTDGVGTKLKLAFETGKHNSIGIDLVAMCVNDLICVGARPLFFLDYYATGKLNTQQSVSILEGIVKGCLQAGCALVGGETAEMPGFYEKGEYDLAGFAVGMVDKKNLIPQKKIKSGDILIGLPSSGFHSNGYSLLRKLIPKAPHQRKKWIQALLEPTRIYVSELIPLIEKGWIKGAAHITGSGFLNIPRISEQVSYEIFYPPLVNFPWIFQEVQKKSGLSLKELFQTFNCGTGMVVVVDPKNADKVLSAFKKIEPLLLGTVIPKKGPHSHVLIHTLEEGLISLS